MIIAVNPNKLGHLELEPVDADIRRMIILLNTHDATCTVYLQSESEVQEFLNTLPTEAVEEINKGYKIQVSIDEHTFRHMVGGQSD